MRILFCSQTSLSRERGGSKVVIELADELQMLGWTCELVSPDILGPSGQGRFGAGYSALLRNYLQMHAGRFDVIDYDHAHLPYPRGDFPRQTLFVARAVLLAHHFERIAIPDSPGIKPWIRSMVLGKKEARERARRTMQAHRTVLEADLVNVANYDDKVELIRCGVPSDKIEVIPYGIGRDRRSLFDAISSAVPPASLVGFVGVFDNRKGATDLPEIIRSVCSAVPEARFRLMGVLVDDDVVLRTLPRSLRDRVEIISCYAPNELPGLLRECSIGVFPSYIEAFGFGVLEMLAASVPVVAYDSPGPPMLLPRDWLVPRGDSAAMSALVIDFLRNRSELETARETARERSKPFSWEHIARTTAEIYEKRWRAIA